MKVRVKSTGALKRMSQTVPKGKIEVVAGVFSGATNNETGQKVASYAQMLEFGTKNMPARPFMRQTAKKCSREWKTQIREGVRALGLQRSEKVLDQVGRMMAKDIVSTIRDGQFAPLDEKTVKAKARKGRPEPKTPLIDTTSLIKSIGSEVRK